jgi:hypothetical protein
MSSRNFFVFWAQLKLVYFAIGKVVFARVFGIGQDKKVPF